MTTLPMTPIPVPPEAAASRPALAALNVGPPAGVTDCGTVEVLAGSSHQGYPMFACYWRPDHEQLQALVEGGFIELIQYYPRLVMHSMTVWSAAPDEVEGCGWVDCPIVGDHDHERQSKWVNPGDPMAGSIGVVADSKGQVSISEAALAQLLTDAGWERAR